MVGLVTAVISRVELVTSTCVRSSLGDIRGLSGPIPPGSSGTAPGQISTTIGFSAAATSPATHIHESRRIARRMNCTMIEHFRSVNAIVTAPFSALSPVRNPGVGSPPSRQEQPQAVHHDNDRTPLVPHHSKRQWNAAHHREVNEHDDGGKGDEEILADDAARALAEPIRGV